MSCLDSLFYDFILCLIKFNVAKTMENHCDEKQYAESDESGATHLVLSVISLMFQFSS